MADSDIVNTVTEAAKVAKEDVGEPCTRGCNIAEPAAECEKVGVGPGRSKRNTPHSKYMLCFKVLETGKDREILLEYAMKIISKVICEAFEPIDGQPIVTLGDVDLECPPGSVPAASSMACGKLEHLFYLSLFPT